MNGRKIKVHHKVSAAVLLIDDYSDEIVKDANILVQIKNSNYKPIIKNDGYYIFTNMEDGVYTISITSNIYMDEAYTIDLMRLDPLNPVVKIRLKPNSRYPFVNGTTCILGKLVNSYNQPIIKAKVKIIPLSQGQKIRMAKDIEKNDEHEIFLNHPQNLDLTLKSFWINDREKEEICTIKKEIENKTYAINEKLTYKHEKGTELLRVYDTVTDEKGLFYLFIKYSGINQEKNKAKIMIYDGMKRFEDEIAYLSNQTNDLGSIHMR